MPPDGQKARWGFCNNIPSQGCQTSDTNDSDAAIGIGLGGNHKTAQGAGWTKDFAGKGKTVYKKVWLYVADLDFQPNWTPVMKIMTNTFGYDSKYWTDTKTLRPTSALEKKEDAKYPAFLNAPFSSIRVCVGQPTAKPASTNCVTHTFPVTYANAKTLFSSGYIRDPNLDQSGFEGAFAATGHKKCGMQVNSLHVHIFSQCMFSQFSSVPRWSK